MSQNAHEGRYENASHESCEGGDMDTHKPLTLSNHLKQGKYGYRCFENAFQSVARMVLENGEGLEKKVIHGKGSYGFKIFHVPAGAL